MNNSRSFFIQSNPSTSIITTIQTPRKPERKQEGKNIIHQLPEKLFFGEIDMTEL